MLFKMTIYLLKLLEWLQRYIDYKRLANFLYIPYIVSFFYLDDSSIRHIFKHQITDLILYNNDEYPDGRSLGIYTEKVYSYVLALFQNLKHLTLVGSSVNDYAPLSVDNLQLTTYFSSTLTVLCINLLNFEDCYS